MTYQDHFTTTRWLASSTLEGRWRMGPWQFRPSAAVAYIEDSSDSYVDTLGVTIPDVKSTLGQANFGPEIAYRYVVRDGSILEPRLSLQGIWNFTGNGADVVAGVPAGPEEIRGRVELGMRAITPSGLTVDVSGSYDGIGAGSWHAVSGMASISVPLN
jgi:outer membrane autotransporter protein